MNDQDTLQRFLFEHASIRGDIVHLNDTFTTLINQRPYPESIKKLLGEALVSCVLLTGSIKFEGMLSLQFQGDKRLPLLLVQCDHQQQLRGFAKFEEGLSPDDYQEAFMQGTLVLTINQYHQTQSWQSVVAIHSTAMADNLMHYFAQSEQIATRVWLAVDEHCAAGMLLQLMPGQGSLQREQFWEHAVILGETVTNQELLTLDNVVLLHRLYHESELRVFDPRPVRFQCRCSPEKMKQVLKVLGQAEIDKLLQEKGEVTVKCDFCMQSYSFDSIDVAMLFH